MTTRCPRCGTAFKVVADQLRVRNGLVRCGVCSHVFDGFAAIVNDQAAAAPPDASLPSRSVAGPAQSDAEMPSAVSSVPADRPSSHGAPVPALPSADAVASRSADTARPAVPAAHVPAVPAAHVPAQPYRPPVSPAYPPHSWQSPLPAQEPEPYNQPAADAPSSQPLLSPIDTEALRRIVPSPSRSEPIARPLPRTPYIPPPYQAQPQPQPPRQGSGPYAVRVSEPPAFTTEPPGFATEPAVLRGRSDTRRHEPTVSSGGQQDEEDVPDRADDQVFPVDNDEEGHDHYVSHDREDLAAVAPRGRDGQGGGRYSIYVDSDRQDDEPGYVPIPGEARTRYDEAVDAGMAPPQFMDEGAQRRIAIIRRLWAYGCLAGLIVLGVQWVYVYRTAIVAAVPALRPGLQSVCDTLGCQVGYARRIERISITSSSLQPPANAGAGAAEGGPSRLVLAVTLRNRYDKPQPWPALVLQLTDLSDTVVVRKVLRPEDYLPAGAAGAFAAGAEQSISVPIQVSGIQVNGYQLDKFFP
jgi:predicted Zn finger-like uncharacterized protein